MLDKKKNRTVHLKERTLLLWQNDDLKTEDITIGKLRKRKYQESTSRLCSQNDATELRNRCN